MADAIAMENNDSLKECERFVRIFNKFFDIMNVRSTTEYVHSRNYDADDERLKVRSKFL